jgi:hypothetical protein
LDKTGEFLDWLNDSWIRKKEFVPPGILVISAVEVACKTQHA